jgi:hypothetical protein
MILADRCYVFLPPVSVFIQKTIVKMLNNRASARGVFNLTKMALDFYWMTCFSHLKSAHLGFWK